MSIVAKFGGSSLADGLSIRKAIEIVQSDSDRRYVVVSAPGRCNLHDQKITDLFYAWQRLSSLKLPCDDVRKIIGKRYLDIVRDLGLPIDLESDLEIIGEQIKEGGSPDYAASRGEYLNGKIIAQALGYDFVDPATCIYFDSAGRYQRNDQRLGAVLNNKRAVIPGFYGSMPDGAIKTFSRGGSDLTGAIVARAAKADLYENWTDVPGLLMADPRIIRNPRKIEVVTYRELRELAYMGASVYHDEAMFPVQEAGIITNIRNTANLNDPGTRVIPEKVLRQEHGAVIGIAGRKDFSVIMIEKTLMNQEIGFVRRVLSVLEANRVSFEHLPSGIDTLSVIVNDRYLQGKLERVIADIKSECSPDTLEVYPDMAMIATVGRAMAHTPGIAAKLFRAVADAGVNVRMINQGSSEISILIGVENADYEEAVRAIYQAFVE